VCDVTFFSFFWLVNLSDLNTTYDQPQVDSMRGVMLVSRAEETFSITQWTDDASKSTTPSDDAHYIAKKLNIK
jgi:acyl carrier protein